jgi:dihydrofolate reductase
LTPIVLIAAVAANGAIGRDNRLLWRLKSDMAHFRAATAGLPLVMGRKTFESFGGKPLPRRLNIVASRQPGLSLPGAVVTGSLDEALALAHAEALRSGAAEIAVLGGADIYAQAMPRADRLLITQVAAEPDADAFFPRHRSGDLERGDGHRSPRGARRRPRFPRRRPTGAPAAERRMAPARGRGQLPPVGARQGPDAARHIHQPPF